MSLPGVRTQAAPNVRLSPDAPQSAFMPPEPIDISKITEVAAQIHDQEKDKADRVALMGAQSKLSALETDLLHGKEGVLNRRGENAFGTPEVAQERWNKATSEIEMGLANDRQKEAFRRAQIERWDNVNGAVQRHVAKESQEHAAKEFDSFLETERDGILANYMDGDRVKAGIARQVAAIKDFAADYGLGEEQLEESISKVVGATHLGVLEMMTANDQDILASQYYQQNKDQIAGKFRAKIEKDLEESSLRGKSQRDSDDILSKTSTQSEADELVKKITDPKLRDEVQKRVDDGIRRRKQIERDTEDDNFKSAANLIDQRPGANPRNVIPPRLWNSLTLQQRAALKSYSDFEGGGSGGGGGVTGDKAWLDFIELTDEETKNLTRSELETKYLRHLKPRERSRAITAWKNAIEGKGKSGDGDSKGPAANIITPAERVKASLIRARMVPDAEPAKMDDNQRRVFRETEAEADEGVREFVRVKGRNPDPTETQQIIDRVILQKAFDPKKTDAKTISIRERGRIIGSVRRENDGTPRARAKDIPPDVFNEFRRLARERGVTLTTTMAERAYAARLMFGIAEGRAVIR
jgi:hypothetical protein